MDMQIFALPLPQELSVQTGKTLCLAATAEKARRYRDYPAQSGAQLSLAAQVLLRYAASRVLGCGMAQVRVAYLPDGRPTLPGTGLYCSVSHTPGLCVCAVASQPVGIDAERIRRPFPPGAAKRVFSDRERSQALAASDPDAAWTALWTQHESYTKLTGAGLRQIREPIPDNVCLRVGFLYGTFAVSAASFTEKK